METPIPVDLGRIAQDLQIRRVQVESVVQLLDEGNTVPFITRYRKERTGNLNEVAIREIQARVKRLRDLAERKETILKAIEAQGKLSDDLRDAIKAADNPKRLEDLYLPYKPKKRTKASEAREKGLEPLALRIWNRDETLTDLAAAAAEFVNAENGLETPESVLEGVGHILSESINELAIVREAVRRTVWKLGKVATTKAESVPEGQGLEYRDYFAYSEPVGHIPPHRVLAINRGDKENQLKVKLDVPRQELERSILGQLPLDGHPHGDFFARAALDALDRLLLPSLEREVRRDLTEMAERHAVDVFARNLRSLLLQPPILKQTVLAIDPGFRTGCKVAVLGPHGELLEQTTIHPHQPQNRRHEAKQVLKDLVGKHQVGVVAIGNGTACRETEELVAEIISEGTMFHTDPEAAARAMAVPAPAAPAAPEGASHPEAPAEDAPESPDSEAAAPEEPADSPVTMAEAVHQAEEAAEAPTLDAAPALDPQSDHNSSAPTENGPIGHADGAEPVEAMPPITGGAPDEGEESPPPPHDPAPRRRPRPPTPRSPRARPTRRTSWKTPTPRRPATRPMKRPRPRPMKRPRPRPPPSPKPRRPPNRPRPRRRSRPSRPRRKVTRPRRSPRRPRRRSKARAAKPTARPRPPRPRRPLPRTSRPRRPRRRPTSPGLPRPRRSRGSRGNRRNTGRRRSPPPGLRSPRGRPLLPGPTRPTPCWPSFPT